MLFLKNKILEEKMQKESENNVAIKRKYPDPVILVIVKDQYGKYNPVPCSWAMVASGEPFMFAFALAAKRYSLEAVRKTGEFVISFPSESMANAVAYYGSCSGDDTDKFKEEPIPTAKADLVDSLILKESVANFECVLDSEFVVGDHVIIFARVLKSWENEDDSLRRLFNLEAGSNLGGVRFC